ncbi:MAG: transposase [Candidatus Sigynarchaeota archaeon]
MTNKKTGKSRKYKTATRDVFFHGIGTHRVVFIDASGKDDDSGVIDDGTTLESNGKKRFRVFIASNLTWDAGTILSLYSLRWTIETAFRDLSQNLGLHGCQWQELDGQRCFLALTFTCYLFLVWAKLTGQLTRYGVQEGTIGDLKRAFVHYCQDTFVSWLHEIRVECGTCPVARWIDEHVFVNPG